MASNRSAGKDSFEYLDEDSLFRLVNSISKDRDRLVIKVLYELGCTIKELVNIRIRDIDFVDEIITVRRFNSRNRMDRVARISGETAGKLKNYLSSTGLLDKKLSYLFQTSRGTHLTTRRIFQIVGLYCRLAKVSKNPSPQLIKYTHIVHAYLNDVPISDIQNHVGITKQRLAQIFENIKVDKATDTYNKFFRKLELKRKKFINPKSK